MTKKELAQSICNLVGESNIRTIANCYTRVRLTVKDPEKMRREELKKLEGVLGVIEEGSHVQLVLGPGTAAAVAQLMSDMTQIKSEEVDEAVLLKEENRAKNNVPYKNMLKKIANIFIPIIPAFIACGLVVAVYESSYVFFPGFQDTDFGKIMSALAYSVFTILPIIVGYNTSKEFGGSPIIGAVLASILNSSSLAGVQLFHVSITPGRGGVISVLIIAYVAVLLEKQLQKVIPDFLDMFLRPLITVCVMTFVGLMVFQPIRRFHIGDHRSLCQALSSIGACAGRSGLSHLSASGNDGNAPWADSGQHPAYSGFRRHLSAACYLYGRSGTGGSCVLRIFKDKEPETEKDH